MIRLGAIATGGRWSHQATCALWKGTLVGLMSGVEPRIVGNTLADGLCNGGGYHSGWKPPWLGKAGHAPFVYTLVFALQLRKSTENLGQCSRVVGDCLLCGLGHLFRDSLSCPAEHQFISVTRGWRQSALGQHKCLPSCQTKGFPASAKFESKLSVSDLMWSAKNRIP
jgi:hypothetical protein